MVIPPPAPPLFAPVLEAAPPALEIFVVDIVPVALIVMVPPFPPAVPGEVLPPTLPSAVSPTIEIFPFVAVREILPALPNIVVPTAPAEVFIPGVDAVLVIEDPDIDTFTPGLPAVPVKLIW